MLAASQRSFRQVQNLTQGVVPGRLEMAADRLGVSLIKTLKGRRLQGSHAATRSGRCISSAVDRKPMSGSKDLSGSSGGWWPRRYFEIAWAHPWWCPNTWKRQNPRQDRPAAALMMAGNGLCTGSKPRSRGGLPRSAVFRVYVGERGPRTLLERAVPEPAAANNIRRSIPR